MGKITVQMKDPKLAEVLASTRAGDEVELKDGDAVVGSFVRREGDPAEARSTFGMLRPRIAGFSDDSIVGPIPPADLGLRSGDY
ncbi:hypothetical protein [Caenispirillum bisanense]|uniref:hypothetical protein n=1 Tax=Caenispirillum bisanense TaxID=414052 RepID=UPI0031DA1372